MQTSSANKVLKDGGTLDPVDHVYIERTEDQQAYELLMRGEFCNILTSRQVGKSSLMVWLSRRLLEQGRRVAMIDIAGDLGTPADARDWYLGLLTKINLDLERADDVEQWWNVDGKGTANQRLMQFFRERLDLAADNPLVVFVDEIEASLKLPYTDDFFTGIRSMYNQRSEVPAYRFVTFCLLGNASPNELIKDRRTTPYNIGKSIELRDFDSRDDLRPLYRAMSPDAALGKRLVDAVMLWTDGHPLLTMSVCRAVVGKRHQGEVEFAIREIATGSSNEALRTHFEWINNFVATRLQAAVASLRLYSQIYRLGPAEDRTTTVHVQLRLSGLVKRDSTGRLIVRNRIYRERFDRVWIAQTAPMRTFARVKKAAIGGCALLALVIGYLGYRLAVLGPRQRVTEDAIVALKNTSSEKVAAETFRVLLGNRTHDGKQPAEYDRGKALDLYQAFWTRRASLLDAMALSQARDGDREGACILGALAGLKRGEAVAPEIQKIAVEDKLAFRTTTWRDHGAVVRMAAWAPDGRYVVSLDADHNALVLSDDPTLQPYAFTDIRYVGYDATKRGPALIVVEEDAVDVWFSPLPLGAASARLSVGAMMATVSPLGTMLGLVTKNNGLALWRTEAREAAAINAHAGAGFLSFSGDGMRIVSVSGMMPVRIWNDDLHLVKQLRPQAAIVHAALSDDGDSLLMGSKHGQVFLQAVAGAAAESREVAAPFPFVKQVRFCADGRRFAFISEQYLEANATVPVIAAVTLWSRYAGGKLDELVLTNQKIHDVDRRCEAVVSSDAKGRVMTWSVKPATAPQSPDQLWMAWQRKLSLTVNEDPEGKRGDKLVPLGHAAPRTSPGAAQAALAKAPDGAVPF